MQGAGGGARGPRARVQVGARRAQSLWGSSFSVRAGAGQQLRVCRGEGGWGAGSGGARRLLGEVGLDGEEGCRGNPGAGAPCSQECNGSVSLVALIPSSAQAQLCGCLRGAGRELGRGVPSDERGPGQGGCGAGVMLTAELDGGA